MPYYNENTVYYRRLTASYGDVQFAAAVAAVAAAITRRDYA